MQFHKNHFFFFTVWNWTSAAKATAAIHGSLYTEPRRLSRFLISLVWIGQRKCLLCDNPLHMSKCHNGWCTVSSISKKKKKLWYSISLLQWTLYLCVMLLRWTQHVWEIAAIIYKHTVHKRWHNRTAKKKKKKIVMQTYWQLYLEICTCTILCTWIWGNKREINQC